MTTNSTIRASTTQKRIQPTLVIFRAECGSESSCTRAMIPKIPGSVPPHRKPSTIRAIALFWRDARSAAELSGAWFIGVLVVRGGAGSVGERAAVGVAFEGRRLGQHHDPLDHSPPRADPAGEDGDDDLEDADGGVAEQEAVHAEAAEEDAQQPHHEAALRLALGCAALGRGALREASLAGRAGAAGLAIGVGGRGAGARCCGPALLPLGVGIGGGPGRRLRERILPGGGLLSVGVRGGAGRGLREGVLAVGALLAVGARRAVRALLAIRALRAGRVLRAVGILLAVGLCAGGRLTVRALRRAGLLGGRLRPRILRGLRR